MTNVSMADVVQMDGAAFAAWLRANREAYNLEQRQLGERLGVATEAVEGFEKGYFCRQMLREELFRLFEQTEKRPRHTMPETKAESESELVEGCKFAVWVKKQRQALGMSQNELAKVLGFGSKGAVAGLEHGSWRPIPERKALIIERIKQLREQPCNTQQETKPETMPETAAPDAEMVYEQATASPSAPEDLAEPEEAVTEKPDQQTILSLAQDALNQKDFNFGAWLRELRQAHGLTQKEFAKSIGSSQACVCRIENGDKSMPLRKRNAFRQKVEKIWGFAQKTERSLGDALTQTGEMPWQDAQDFCCWMKEQRLALGMSQKEFAHAIGYDTRHAVSQLERGEWYASPKKQMAIAERIEEILTSRDSTDDGTNDRMEQKNMKDTYTLPAEEHESSAAAHTDAVTTYDASDEAAIAQPVAEMETDEKDVSNKLATMLYRLGDLAADGFYELDNMSFFELRNYALYLLFKQKGRV